MGTVDGILQAMTQELPRRLECQYMDWSVHCLAAVFVPEIQLVVDFGGRVDGERLARALRLLLDAEPVLGCRFVVSNPRPYWERLDEDLLDQAQLLEVVESEAPCVDAEIMRFLAPSTDWRAGPQVLGALLRNGDSSRLVLTVNHLPADAGATKQVGYKVAEIYRQLVEDPSYLPEPNEGSRSMRRVYDQVPLSAAPRLFGRMLRQSLNNHYPTKTLRLYGADDWSGEVTFVFHHFDGPRVTTLRAYGVEKEATLNDLFVAATFRALARLLDWKGKRTLRLGGTVDLRCHLPEDEALGICNLSAFTFPNLGRDLGESFDDTLERVKSFMNGIKAFHIGTELHPLIYMSTRPFAFDEVYRRVSNTFKEMSLRGYLPNVLTNMGRIDLSRLALTEAQATGAFLVVPAGFPPGLPFGLSGDGTNMTLSGGFYDSAFEPRQIEELFSLVDDELP